MGNKFGQQCLVSSFSPGSFHPCIFTQLGTKYLAGNLISRQLKVFLLSPIK